jgi:hypothetical protein
MAIEDLKTIVGRTGDPQHPDLCTVCKNLRIFKGIWRSYWAEIVRY